MVLTEREVDKLVHVLNHMVKRECYNPEEDGFSYDDDLNIFAFDCGGTVDFESGLDFLIDTMRIQYTDEEKREMERIK